MQFSQKTKQPFRLWYEYLQECLKHPKLFKINKDFYKPWHLNQVKTLKFDHWFKEHSHLFSTNQKGDIQIYNGKKDDNSIIVSIPKHMNVQEIQKAIGKVVKGKVNIKEAKFNITNNKNFIDTASMDYFLWSWQFKQMKKYQGRGGLIEIWNEVESKRLRRHNYMKSKNVKEKGKRYFQVTGATSSSSSDGAHTHIKSIMVSRFIKKAQRILENVSKGVFPGNYAK